MRLDFQKTLFDHVFRTQAHNLQKGVFLLVGKTVHFACAFGFITASRSNNVESPLVRHD